MISIDKEFNDLTINDQNQTKQNIKSLIKISLRIVLLFTRIPRILCW